MQQHLSCIQAFTMNAFITLTLLAAAASACPEMAPVECGADEFNCPGGMDAEGCMMPDLCVPSKGPMGFDGVTECPSNCPATCGAEELWCPGPMDTNGCMGPETCMPMKGNLIKRALISNIFGKPNFLPIKLVIVIILAQWFVDLKI